MSEKIEKYKQALDEKNEFLQNLGISSNGEFKRVTLYLQQINQKNKKYKQALEEIKFYAYHGRYLNNKQEHLEHIYELCREVLND